MPVAKKCYHPQDRRGKNLRKNPFKKETTFILVTTLLLTTLITLSLPEAKATPITIEFIDSSSGYVGDTVQVVGEIDTVNGSYIIFFDEEDVRDGTAIGTAVNDTFVVPPSPMGSYTVTLHDVTTKSNYTSSELFTVQTAYFIKAVVPSPPEQSQEGTSTKILVNVTGGAENTVYSTNVTITDPLGTVFYNDTLQLTDTTNTGYGEGNVTYPADFGVGAHTNYTGTYHIAFNETLATANFTVGLTDKLEYVRRYLSAGEEETSEVVIQSSGYDNETATINITYYNKTTLIPVEGYPKKENVSNGIVTHKWKIPDNATLATYNVTLTSATIEKPVKDTQNFTVIEIIVSCQTQNRYDNKTLAGVSIHASTDILYVGGRITNETGWVDFWLERGYYSFEAYWREVQVGNLSSRLEENPVDYVLRISFHIKCKLANITINVRDKDSPLPFIDITLANATMAPNTIPPFQTNHEGLTSSKAFTDVVYTIEARRYGHLFFNQSIGNLTKTIGNLTEPFLIVCPTYTLFIHASDSKEYPIQNARVEVVEWSSGRIAGEGNTDEWGSIRLDCTFGRYKVRVYNYSEMLGQTVILNETVGDVVRDDFYLVLHCRTVNLDLSVKALDYFGQPIPNAIIKIEREGIEIVNLPTKSDGTASEHEILGGDCRISLYVAGRLYEIKSLFLDESGEIIFQVGDYVMVGGYPLECNQLITGISLTLLVVLSVLVLIYRRRSRES